MSSTSRGYRGRALEVLKHFGIRVWSEARITTTQGDFQGIVLPRSENDDDLHIVLKLDNGYNVGIAVDSIDNIEEKAKEKNRMYIIGTDIDKSGRAEKVLEYLRSH